MFRLVILTLSMLLTGCATTLLAPKPISTSDLSETNGILIGSFARDPDGPTYYSQTIRYKNNETGKEHEITAQLAFNMFNGKTPDDFKTKDSHGGVFAFSLPAGEYTFYNFRLYQSNGYFHQNWTSIEPFDIPFTVKPNRVNYVGEIKLSPFTGKNLFGMRVHAGGLWLVSNQSSRDFDIMMQKYPEIRLDKVNNIVPSEKKIFTPLVILPSEIEAYRKAIN